MRGDVVIGFNREQDTQLRADGIVCAARLALMFPTCLCRGHAMAPEQHAKPTKVACKNAIVSI
jgi:hypothetical protein